MSYAHPVRDPLNIDLAIQSVSKFLIGKSLNPKLLIGGKNEKRIQCQTSIMSISALGSL